MLTADGTAASAPLKGSDARDRERGAVPDEYGVTDAHLVQWAQDGYDEAFELLVRRHRLRAYRVALRLTGSPADAEDVAQDAFVALHGRWGRLREPASAVAYLRRSVVNGCRSAQRRAVVADRHQSEPRGNTASAEASVLAGERRAEVLAALARIPRRQREVLVLRHWLDLSEADIAAVLRISRGAVKSHASRGSAALRATLGHLLEETPHD